MSRQNSGSSFGQNSGRLDIKSCNFCQPEKSIHACLPPFINEFDYETPTARQNLGGSGSSLLRCWLRPFYYYKGGKKRQQHRTNHAGGIQLTASQLTDASFLIAATLIIA